MVRISNRVTFVDGDRVTRDDAVARCKSTDGATVVLEALAPNPEWDATRAALEQEGVRIYVLDKLCNRPGRYACMPILPGHPMSDPKRRPTVQPQPQPQPKPKPKPQP